MRAIIQRVEKASVTIEGNLYSKIDKGLLVLLAITGNDSEEDLNYMINKILGLRIFNDKEGKMNLSVVDISGQLLVVSQFTLYGDVRKGKRPSFIQSAKGDFAEQMYNRFVSQISEQIETKTGVFGSDMKVELINDGPVTIQLDSSKIY